jgi:hypothetical protein
MSGLKSGTAARLLLQVTSETEIALRRHCPRCKLPQRFESSGKFRVNAQKKRIDAWLIFRCAACEDRWNWPIHERQPVTALDPDELDALMRNDPGLAVHHGRAALLRHGAAAGGTSSICLTVLEPMTADTSVIEIVLAGGGPRLDRLLAQALTLSRHEIEAMEEDCVLVLPGAPKALRRPAVEGQRILVAFDRCGSETAGRLRRRLEAQEPDL